MKQGIDFIHDLCRGHQDLHHGISGILETQQVNGERSSFNIDLNQKHINMQMTYRCIA